MLADDESKNISKVREFIREFSKRNKELKASDGWGQSTRPTNDSPEDKSHKVNQMKETVDVWHDLMN